MSYISPGECKPGDGWHYVNFKWGGWDCFWSNWSKRGTIYSDFKSLKAIVSWLRLENLSPSDLGDAWHYTTYISNANCQVVTIVVSCKVIENMSV